MSFQTSWLAGPRKSCREVKRRLFCFPHAGGGSSLFADWRDIFGPEVEVCPVILPGREARIGEAPFRRMSDIVPVIVEELSPFMDKPFSFFGHSLGSIIAFEVAQKAVSLNLPIEKLLVSGRRAAHIGLKGNLLYELNDTEFLKAIECLNGTPKDIIQDKEIMNYFLPCLRADFELHETYIPFEGNKLNCDLVALTGDEDKGVNLVECMAWRELTSRKFDFHICSGDHFYLSNPKDVFLDILKSIMIQKEVNDSVLS